MKTFRIAVLPGDGIGPEVIAEGVAVLRALEPGLDGVQFEMNEFAAGAGEYLHSGDPFPEQTFEQCKQHDAILLGAMGLPDVRLPSGVEVAPQLDLRERLDLYCGLRPIRLYHADHSPLKGYEAGEIDLIYLAVTAGRRVLRDSRLENETRLVPAAQIRYLGLNQTQYEPFKDIRVREAVCISIDRLAMIDGLYGGARTGSDHPLVDVLRVARRR